MANDSILNQKRKKNWFSNVLHRMDFQKRNPKIWIFGSWNGKYKDNSRYLFEYVCKNKKDIQAYYFVDNQTDFNAIQKMGNHAVMIGTEEAKEIAKKAGVSFYTNGMDDFGDQIYNYGSIKVALWHGVGFKKIYYSEDNYHESFIKKVYHGLFSCVARDYTITTSETMKQHMIKCFSINDPSTVLIIGQPRNDVFFNNSPEKKEILYLPTYRRNPANNIYIQKVVDYFCSEEFVSRMREKGYKLIVKAHPLTKGITFNTNDVILDGNGLDTQELLTTAAVVITDYSSVISDFAITGRKVILYAPDYKEYLEEEGLIDCAKQVYDPKYMCVTESDILNKLEDECELTGILNQLFNESLSGNYSQKVTEAVKLIAEKKYN